MGTKEKPMRGNRLAEGQIRNGLDGPGNQTVPLSKKRKKECASRDPSGLLAQVDQKTNYTRAVVARVALLVNSSYGIARSDYGMRTKGRENLLANTKKDEWKGKPAESKGLETTDQGLGQERRRKNIRSQT